MDNNSNFQTYLFINSKNFEISVNNLSDFKILYEKKKIYQNNFNELDYHQLDVFLKENIYEIEKRLNSFVKNIILIIDFDFYFNLSVSIKRNNDRKFIKLEDINYLLNDLRDQCQKTISEQKIIHLIIDNYKINNDNYSFLPKEINCDFFSLDVTFVCLSNEIFKRLEKVFEKYHISIAKIINYEYMKNLFNEDINEPFVMADRLLKGYNKNEVMFTQKTIKNKGFFEKFFHFFS